MKLLRRLIRRLYKYLEVLMKPIYKVYEKWLWIQISEGPMPRHVAIIPDGNRRWAREVGKPITYGYDVGYDKMKNLLTWILELGVKVITIYAMSYENCIYRSEEERMYLFKLLDRALNDLMYSSDVHEKKVRVRVFGRLDMIPEELIAKIRKVEELTKNYSDRYINVAICYGGRQEIVDAIKKLVDDLVSRKLSIDNINENMFRKYLYTSYINEPLDEPDLVIRTSGELRLSNFLLWQIAYSELYFCDVFWPDFRKIDLWRAIRSYQRRERRFGR
ncbi:MAG: polyprenyl diphosphate synthase [Sulfolobales archaeon]